MTGIIYQITNQINKHSYIGKTTKSETDRFYRHKWNAQHNIHTHLYRAMRKYGVESFSISIIEQVELSLLNDREKYWIQKVNPEYNMTEGGDGGDTSTSPNYQKSLQSRRDTAAWSGTNNTMYGKKRNIPKKQLENAHREARIANKCPVLCDGIYYESVGLAEKAYPNINLRKKLDNPLHPNFIRLRPKTTRIRKK